MSNAPADPHATLRPAASAQPPEREWASRIGWRDKLLFALFLGLWILPITWVGVSNTPVPRLGRFLNNQYRVGCLFTKIALSWPAYYVQVRGAGGGWREVPLADYSPMRPFGYWSRLHMLLARSDNQPHGLAQRQDVAAFIQRRHLELHEEHLDAVRFAVGESVTMGYRYPAGHWVKPPLESYPAGLSEVVSSHWFDGRSPEPGRGMSPLHRGLGECH